MPNPLPNMYSPFHWPRHCYSGGDSTLLVFGGTVPRMRGVQNQALWVVSPLCHIELQLTSKYTFGCTCGRHDVAHCIFWLQSNISAVCADPILLRPM